MAQQTLIINIKPNRFSDFLVKLEDLTKINDIIKIKIDSTDTLMYSMVGETQPLAFKNYVFPTDEYFEIDDEFFNHAIAGFVLDIIIIDAKKFVKNLSFVKYTEKIVVSINYVLNDEGTIAQCRHLKLKNGKLVVQVQGGEHSNIRDITRQALLKTLDVANKKWGFLLPRLNFIDIKKLASINSEGKIIHVNVEDEKIIFSESNRWELEVGSVDTSNKHIIFNKTFLSCINDEVDEIEFFVFPTFVLTKDDNSNLMISFEQNFEEED